MSYRRESKRRRIERAREREERKRRMIPALVFVSAAVLFLPIFFFTVLHSLSYREVRPDVDSTLDVVAAAPWNSCAVRKVDRIVYGRIAAIMGREGEPLKYRIARPVELSWRGRRSPYVDVWIATVYVRPCDGLIPGYPARD